MFRNSKTVASDESCERYEVTAVKVGSEYGPAVSVYWNDRLTDFCELYYYILILQNERRTVLVNTGLPDDISAFERFVKAWHPECRIQRSEDERTAAALAHASVDPARVETVLVTPLTVYTTGQLPLFSNARFAISRRGWIDFWAPRPHAPKLPHDIAIARDSRIYLADTALDRVRLLDDEDTVCPGIEVFWTGGHHSSSMAIRVSTTQGNCGDRRLLFHLQQPGKEHPDRLAGESARDLRGIRSNPA
jgi:glyoxylase-like metal-dependent hydrolase (beta-lactamase superfamily II)